MALIYLSIADELRDQIMLGTYPAGTRLPSENDLAARFGAARTSVREALRVLVSQGLIETTRGATGGSTVLELSHRDVMRILEQNMQYLMASRGATRGEMEEVRELVETTGAWMAAARRTPQHVDALYACIPDIDPEQGPTAEQVQTNLRFHYEILEASGNRLLHLFGEPVAVTIYSYFTRDEHEPVYYQQVLDDHRRIADAISARDADLARRLMSEHLRATGEHLPTSPLAGLRFD